MFVYTRFRICGLLRGSHTLTLYSLAAAMIVYCSLAAAMIVYCSLAAVMIVYCSLAAAMMVNTYDDRYYYILLCNILIMHHIALIF